MSVEEKFKERMSNPVYKQWYDERPPIIQEMIRKYPYDYYRMTPDAPYGITCPGSKVELLGYNEDYTVSVKISPEDFLEQTKAHIRHLCDVHKKDYNKMSSKPTMVQIHPDYMVPWTDEPGLSIWVIYDNPTDFPGKFVVRKWIGEAADKEPLIVADTLEEARKALPKHIVRLMPSEGDDPKIVETWL